MKSDGSIHSLRRDVDLPRCKKNNKSNHAEGGVGARVSSKKYL